jgi:S-DNA-T family DNA segregation ATPase FtsK/SpoIIIE
MRDCGARLPISKDPRSKTPLLGVLVSIVPRRRKSHMRQAYAYTMWSPFKTTQTPRPNHSVLPLTLGKDKSGHEVDVDLHSLPNLIVGGMVGSGKSVLLHNILDSLISEVGPDRLRLMLCDTKQVELDVYNNLPHLLTPVINDARKMVRAFTWLNKEIDRRYSVFKEANIRSVDAYHVKVDKWINNPADNDPPEAMPFILAMVDEFSDAMMTYPRETEAVVARVAQLGTQVGVHLIIATSNPGSKVLTSSIKSNIPARVTFQVTSEADSRSVLGSVGAEKLRGIGNALFVARDVTKPISVEAFHVTDEDISETVGWAVKSYAMEPSADEIDFTSSRNHRATDPIFSSMIDDGNESDDLYKETKRAVIEAGKASTSYLQRKLGIGYARAAKLIDLLEEGGVIGPADGSKPREVIEPFSSSGKQH